MTCRSVTILLAVLTVLSPLAAHGQSFAPRLSVKTGLTNLLTTGAQENRYYPEIEVQERLLDFEIPPPHSGADNPQVTVDGSAYAGYWDERLGIGAACDPVDRVCEQAWTVGVRTYVSTKGMPFGIFVGASYTAEREEGYYPHSGRPANEQFGYAGVGGGLRADVALVRGLRLLAQLQIDFELSERTRLPRRSLMLGVSLPVR